MKKLNRREFISNSAYAAMFAAFSPVLLAACKKNETQAKYKLGVFDCTFPGMTGNPEVFGLSKELGLDGVQLSTNAKPDSQVFFSDDQISSFKTKMAETGLEVASTSPTSINMFPFWKDPNAVEFTKKSIDAAAMLGSHSILLPFYGPARMDTAKDNKIDKNIYPELVRRLREIAPYAASKNVVVCMENSVSSDENKRVIDAVGSPFIKVYFDIFNAQFYGMKTVPEIMNSKGYIGQIHLKDKGHKLDSGSGMPENMQACFDAINEIGYEGWLVFELHGFKEGRDGSVKDVVRHNAEFMRNSSLFKA